MLSRGNSISTWRIQNNNSAPSSGLNIDIVHANAGPADNAEARAGLQNIRRNFGLAADNQRVELRDEIDKVALAQAGFDRDLQRAIARKLINAALGNGI